MVTISLQKKMDSLIVREHGTRIGYGQPCVLDFRIFTSSLLLHVVY